MRLSARLLVSTALFVASCDRAAPPPADPSPPPSALERVAAVHGGAGPWAVAGYRMGEAALARLGLRRGSFALEVVHHTPPAVQYACMADGAAAATLASVGKLNLRLEPAEATATRTTFRNRETGTEVTFAVAPAFAARFLGVPRERLAAAGAEALALSDKEVFAEVPAPPRR